MRRREVYATTGPRITLRFFGGWDYASDDALSPNFAEIGYRKGVPMGGDLVLPSEGAAPSFLLRAVKDPDGANLDRVQVVKGWRDAKGELHEEGPRCRLVGRPRQDRRRQAPRRRIDRRRQGGELSQFHRQSVAGDHLDGPGLRSGTKPRSTTCGSSRYRRRAGRPTTRSSTALRRSSRPLPP